MSVQRAAAPVLPEQDWPVGAPRRASVEDRHRAQLTPTRSARLAHSIRGLLGRVCWVDRL